MKEFDQQVLQQIHKPEKNSHKGQNGRLLVIGGSKLFHASIFWSADLASKIVDLVHFTSPANENNEIVRKKLKEGFWNGIVVDWLDVESYAMEDDCVLIGPGMPRDEGLAGGETSTGTIVNDLLGNYPDKRWVVDGGALQEVDAGLLGETMIITPHEGEYARLADKMNESTYEIEDWNNAEERVEKTMGLSKSLGGVTILSKGLVDVVSKGDESVVVRGGNEGMTKGGTGDVLAGLAAALYCSNEVFVAAQVASFVNKKAGDRLYERVGTFFDAGDLVNVVPEVLFELMPS